ncbi:hypothetical protein ACFXPA_00670 [Amycolatopsis sp. NPDC059090]|uniref:hypothetical protein n=1 Tax=unclassified Amycolatopsis TaxID=2618356 RepID=UPI00366AAFD7
MSHYLRPQRRPAIEPPSNPTLAAICESLEEIRRGYGWSWNNVSTMLFGAERGTAHNWLGRAQRSYFLHNANAYAGHLGCCVTVVLKPPRGKRPGWRERMPHQYDPADTLALIEPLRLQHDLGRLREHAGHSRQHLADLLGTTVFSVWQLEHNPREIDAALCNLLTFARFLGATVKFQLQW